MRRPSSLSPSRSRSAGLACAIVVLAAAPEAGAAAPLRIATNPSPVLTGQQVQIQVSGSRSSTCRLTLHKTTSPRSGVLLRRKLRSPFRVSFKTPAAPARRTVRVQCGSKRARRTFQVVRPSTPATAPAPITAAGVEDIGGDLTVPTLDGAAIDSVSVPADAVGGGGFDTMAPFANGFRVKVTQGAGGSYSHSRTNTRHAVDLGAANGTPVLAGFTGVVAATSTGCPNSRSDGCGGGYGNYVLLKAADGTCVVHGHLSAVDVSPGQQVGRYTRLGAVGNSGYSFGPHLHYDRVNCRSWASIGWFFNEMDRPSREGDVLVSQNAPPPPVTAAPTPVSAPSAPRAVVTVDNRTTNGAGMREDPTPLRLTTRPWVRCGSRGCNVNGTERTTGGTYDAAVCQTQGERYTNGNDSSAADDGNPELFTSTLYYGVRLTDGTFGFVSEVWVRRDQRGGLGLPGC